MIDLQIQKPQSRGWEDKKGNAETKWQAFPKAEGI